jgi:ribosomal protein S18 acetylase RimI-like enzyme
VPGVETRPFTEGDLEAAGELLAERHRRHRESEPLLEQRFEEPAHARAAVEELWHREGASGAVAVRGEVVAYVLGVPHAVASTGSHVWVNTAGHAAREAEDIRDAYATAAGAWVEQGWTRQAVLVPSSDTALIDAWFRLSFGHQQVMAVLTPTDAEPEIPDGFSIRPPELDDIDELIRVDVALPQHQAATPVFSGVEPWTDEDSRQEWAETINGADEHVLVGFQGDRPVSVLSMADWSHSRHSEGLLQIDGAAYLGFAATIPEARGSGIGKALTVASLAWAARDGYPVVVTDWRVTNLLASRFWPRRGFRPAFSRLYRSIP